MKTINLLVFLITVAAVTITGCSTEWKGLKASLPDIGGKADGVYRGEYSVTGTPVKVKLDVVLTNQTITSIKIVEHICSPIGKKAEKITETVISKQTLDVDAVSGATGSSMGILKAVENALQ